MSFKSQIQQGIEIEDNIMSQNFNDYQRFRAKEIYRHIRITRNKLVELAQLIDTKNIGLDSSVKDLNNKINAIDKLLKSDTSTLDSIQEIVDYIELNKSRLDSLTISSIAGLQNALNSKAAIGHIHTIYDLQHLISSNIKLNRTDMIATSKAVYDINVKVDNFLKEMTTISDYITVLKGQLDAHNILKKQDLDNHTIIKKQELSGYISSILDRPISYYEPSSSTLGALFINSDGVGELGWALDFHFLKENSDFTVRLEVGQDKEFYQTINLGNGNYESFRILTTKDKLNIYDNVNKVAGVPFVTATGTLEVGQIIDLKTLGSNNDFDGRFWLKENLDMYYQKRGQIESKILTKDDFSTIDKTLELIEIFSQGKSKGFAYIGDNGILEVGRMIDFRHLNHNVDFNIRLELGVDGELYLIKALGNNVFEPREFIFKKNIINNFGGGDGVASANDVKYLHDIRYSANIFEEGKNEGLAYVKADGVTEVKQILDFRKKIPSIDYDYRLELNESNGFLYGIRKENGNFNVGQFSTIIEKDIGNRRGHIKYDDGLAIVWGSGTARGCLVSDVDTSVDPVKYQNAIENPVYINFPFSFTEMPSVVSTHFGYHPKISVSTNVDLNRIKSTVSYHEDTYYTFHAIGRWK